MSDLKTFIGKKINVITTDARYFEGILEGFDKTTNIVLSNSVERIIYKQGEKEENEEIPSGVNIMRGNEIVCIGEIDESQSPDWSKVKGDPLKSTNNPL
ncbi:uncharacterized protein LODBEIA_P53450 [Lodderomyces beijingensis]|uniref:LSM2-LSM8 complex subunit LSM8 n=1 Tax=Lodderomyces beijingensis TaxID=1775926 RepID=A0ABP0ZV96_9ASCO